MRYENNEKRIIEKAHQAQLQYDILDEYRNSDSFAEFLLNLSIKYGYSIPNILNKYWWHYIITDIGKNRFFTIFGISLFCILYSAMSSLSWILISRSVGSILIPIMICSILTIPCIAISMDIYESFDWKIRHGI